MNNETMNNSKIAPLRVILCGPDKNVVLKNMFLPFASHPGGFEVLMMTTTLNAMVRDVKEMNPDLLVIDGSMTPPTDEFHSYLTRLVNATPIMVVFVVPDEKEGEELWTPKAVAAIDLIGDAIDILLAPVDWTKVAERSYSLFMERKVGMKAEL